MPFAALQLVLIAEFTCEICVSSAALVAYDFNVCAIEPSTVSASFNVLTASCTILTFVSTSPLVYVSDLR